jgi:hypothetical protein
MYNIQIKMNNKFNYFVKKVSYIPAGDWKIANLFLQCSWFIEHKGNSRGE